MKKKQKEQSDALNNIFRMRFNSYENSSIDSLYDFEEEVLLAQNLEENEEFVAKYLQDLSKKELEKLSEKKDKKYIKEYIKYQLCFINNNNNIFSNQIFL